MKTLVNQIRWKRGIFPFLTMILFLVLSIFPVVMTSGAIFYSWNPPKEINLTAKQKDYQYSKIQTDQIKDYFIAYSLQKVDKVFVLLERENQLLLIELDGNHLAEIQKFITDSYFNPEHTIPDLIVEEGSFVPMEQEIRDSLINYLSKEDFQQLYPSVFRVGYIGNYSFARLDQLLTYFYISTAGFLLSALLFYLCIRKKSMIKGLSKEAIKDRKEIYSTKNISFGEEGVFFIQKDKIHWTKYSEIENYYFQGNQFHLIEEGNQQYKRGTKHYVIKGLYPKKEEILSHFGVFHPIKKVEYIEKEVTEE